MKDRIKEIRKELGLTQAEFAKRLNAGQTTIAGYENGTRTPSPAMVTLIANVFSANEEWLITGKGEKYISKTRAEDIADLIYSMTSKQDPYMDKLIEVCASLDSERLELLANIAESIAKLK